MTFLTYFEAARNRLNSPKDYYKIMSTHSSRSSQAILFVLLFPLFSSSEQRLGLTKFAYSAFLAI